MEQEQQDSQQQRSRWPPTRKQLLWAGGIAALVFLLIVICGYLFGWHWTGLPRSKVPPITQPTKTLWDWLDLLIIPVVLALGGYLFTRSENRATRETAERRAQDEALQACLEQMGQMLLDVDRPLRRSTSGDNLRMLARARTLTVLPRLGGTRKGTVLQFLYESGLIYRNDRGAGDRGVDRCIVDLRQADLSGVHLEGVTLSSAGLSNANLRGSRLGGSYHLRLVPLTSINFYKATLEEADLSNTDLSGATLEQANLKGASLRGALLWGANLRRADMAGADLTGANLNIRTAFPAVVLREYAEMHMEEFPEELKRRANAFGKLGRAEVQNQELDYVTESLKGATMPTGQKYEDWVKTKNEDWLDPEKRRKEDEENG
jgi:uncharacterized protein YjbI with pentapeptide repeats